MKFILIVTVVYFQLVFTKRVSELKCEEYSKIPKTPERKYPFLVYLTTQLPAPWNNTIHGDFATLVSRRFVVTDAWVSVLQPYQTKVHFSPSEEYDVIEKHIHPTLKNFSIDVVGFLKLDRPVNLDSFHRPVCLWQKDFFYESFANILNWVVDTAPADWTSKVESTEMLILRNADCNKFNPSIDSTYICLQPRDSDKAKYTPTNGSPIQIEITSGDDLPHNFYILGQYIFHYDTTPTHIVSRKISAHLDWLDNLLFEDEITKCGIRFVQATALITNGEPAIRGEFPWHAAISRKEGSGIRKYICGGTLINQNTILSAGHCVYNSGGIVAPELLITSLGKYDLDETTFYSRETGVYKIILHEQYNPTYLENDISILKLRTLIEYSDFIQPICITGDSTIFNSAIGVVSGWGKNELQQQVSILSKASLPIHSHSTCREGNREFFEKFLNENNFCAGYGNGTSVCNGDSGSGLILESQNHFYLRGIVSLGVSLLNESRCDTTQYVVFTDVTKYYSWIELKINN